jgi:hypothetical protein
MEDEYSIAICVAAPGFLDNFIPHGTKVVLQFRKSITYVEFGKSFHSEIAIRLEAISMGCELDKVGE